MKPRTVYEDYIILAVTHIDDLQDIVNERMKDGYSLIGGPFFYERLIGQAIAKPVDETITYRGPDD